MKALGTIILMRSCEASALDASSSSSLEAAVRAMRVLPAPVTTFAMPWNPAENHDLMQLSCH